MSKQPSQISTLDYWTDYDEYLWLKEYHYGGQYSFEDFHNHDILTFYKAYFQGKGRNLRLEKESEHIKLLIMDIEYVNNHCALVLKYK